MSLTEVSYSQISREPRKTYNLFFACRNKLSDSSFGILASQASRRRPLRPLEKITNFSIFAAAPKVFSSCRSIVYFFLIFSSQENVGKKKFKREMQVSSVSFLFSDLKRILTKRNQKRMPTRRLRLIHVQITSSVSSRRRTPVNLGKVLQRRKLILHYLLSHPNYSSVADVQFI